MAVCAWPFYHFGLKMIFACGTCHICKINKRREWTARLILESTDHDKKCFVTLTYNDEHLPEGAELDTKAVTNYLKRLRKVLSTQGKKIRYFYVGEYGELNNRPHYHILLFGLDEQDADLIASKWTDKKGQSIGLIHIGSVTKESIQYVAGYCLKKNFKTSTGIKKQPEFGRMSLRPGIGANVARNMGAKLKKSEHKTHIMEKGGDVPSQVRLFGSMWPIGRYLKNQMRKETDLNEEDCKTFNKAVNRIETETQIRQAEKDPALQEVVLQLKQALRKKEIDKQWYIQLLLQEANKSKVMRSENLSRIYKKGRKLDG